MSADASPPTPVSIKALLAKHAARAEAMSRETSEYWQRHVGRFEFVLRYLQASSETRGAKTFLDVGASFQTLLLDELFPAARIDTLGDGRDERFMLPSPSRHFTFDLNAAAQTAAWPVSDVRYDAIVFMEVIEHLVTPPHQVLRCLGSMLSERGFILLTTPNAAWLKNRLKLLRGQNPFELLREGGGGHIREYALDELETAAEQAGLVCTEGRRLGLYGFTGANDRFYNAVANATHGSLRRSLFLILRPRP